ncbi:FIG040338: Glycosyl transferase [hydrothermal vent metagenome]|uniref:FIG040338: Glycosyl transferase n=1 Tax=hydrothermal vent metagenome TaxID=652676 RepID=A0A3B0ZM71_9ZZZZ
MKVIQLASGDLWAGAEVQLYHMACSMMGQPDVELCIVLLNHGQLEQELVLQGLSVIILDENSLTGLKIATELWKITKQFKPDIIHTHRIKENIVGGFVAKITGCKSVRTVHGADEFKNDPFYSKSRILALMDNLAGKFLQQCVIAVSDELKEKLLAEYSLSSLAVINNGINIPYIEKKALERIVFNHDEDRLNVCFIGRFVEVKRVDLFYELAKKTISNNDALNIHFYMIGDGPLWDEVQQRICDDKLESNIHLTGFVSNTAPYIKQMDLLVFTSDHEGLPMTLLEAMVLGVPVLARKELATIAHVLCGGQCGYVDLGTDANMGSLQLLEILKHRKERVNTSICAKQRVIDKFSIEMNVRSYIQLYSDIINR